MAVLRTARVKICRPLYEKQVLYPQCDPFRRKTKKNDKSPENTKLEQSKYSQPKIAETRKNYGNYRSPIPTNPSYLPPRLPAYRSFRILLSTNHLCTPLPPPFVIHLYKVRCQEEGCGPTANTFRSSNRNIVFLLSESLTHLDLRLKSDSCSF